MTTVNINSAEDLIRAMEARPEFVAAVWDWLLAGGELLEALERHPDVLNSLRQKLQTEAVLKLPEQLAELTERVNSFIASQERFNERQEQFNSYVQGFIEDQKQFNERQERFNERVELRFGRMENDMGDLKNFYMTIKVTGESVSYDFGLTPIRTLTQKDLIEIAKQAQLPINEGRSFINADLVFEAEQEDGSRTLFAVEASYTGAERDADRALRNARILNQATGLPAIPVVASVRNDCRIEELIQSQELRWLQIAD